MSTYAECRYAECRYAECHYAECRSAQSTLKKPVGTNALAYLSGVSVTRQNSFITLPAEGVHRSRSL